MGIEMGSRAVFWIEGRVYHADWNGPTGWGDNIDTVTVVTDGGAQIRGVPVSSYISDEPTVSPDLVDRMMRLVRDLDARPSASRDTPVAAEIRAIVALLPPEPVDPDEALARKLCDESTFDPADGKIYELVKTAIRAGRESAHYQSGRKP